MKTYTKTHKKKEALNNHIAKIKKRGGSYNVNGNTIIYSFNDEKEDKMEGLDFITQKTLLKILKDREINGVLNDITFFDFLKYIKNKGGKIELKMNANTRNREYGLYTKYGLKLKTPKISKKIFNLFNEI